MDQIPLLKVEQLTISFPGEKTPVMAADEVSFSLEQGKTMGIVGESGSGKTITGLSIMRLIPSSGKLDKGKIIFRSSNDEVVDFCALRNEDMTRFRGSRVAMIFQEPAAALNPVHSCGKQVEEIIRLHQKCTRKSARIQTLEVLKRVELQDVERMYRAYPHQLSGGQVQRIMIAMAIANHPGLLIVDEPTTSLDVTVQKKILDLLKKLQAESGMSMIFITHDFGVLAEVADEAIVMQNGKIVERGNIQSLLETPAHPYTRGLLACRPQMNTTYRRLPVLEDFLAAETDQQSKPQQSDETIQHSAPVKSASKQQPIWKVKGLKKWFPVQKTWFSGSDNLVKAVDDVSFEVFRGETLGLVGESGSGKTTLGKSLLRLVEPSAGKIEFNGMNFSDLNSHDLRRARKHIQMVFQDPFLSLNPRINIGQAILEPMAIHGIGDNKKERNQLMLDLLRKVGLDPSHHSRFPHEFSGGQRQRIGIARALAVQPDFIVCDEPVSALDVSIQAQILNLLKDLQDEMGLSYLFISHDLSVVKFMSDRIMVMHKGKIVETGETETVYRSPRSDYTKRLIAALPHQ